MATNKYASHDNKLKPEIIALSPVGMLDYTADCTPFWMLNCYSFPKSCPAEIICDLHPVETRIKSAFESNSYERALILAHFGLQTLLT